MKDRFPKKKASKIFEADLIKVLSEESPNIIFIANEKTVLYANLASCAVLGLSASEIRETETLFYKVLPETALQEIRAVCSGKNSGEAVQRVECVLKSRKRGKLRVALRVMPVKYRGSNSALCVGVELSRRKSLEVELLESERKYDMVFDSLDDAIHVVNRGLKIVLINHGFIELNKQYGIHGDVVGKTVREAYPFLAEKVLTEYEWVFETGNTLITEETMVIGGKESNTQTRKIPVVESGAVTNVITLIRDMTRFRTIEKELRDLNEKLVQSNIKLRQLAFTDSHTGLYNHHFLVESLEAEFSRAKRTGRPLSLMMIDLDNFKSINDVYGHQFGDTVLSQFAQAIKKTAREHDMVMRYGGEEFMIVYQDTDRLSTIDFGHRLNEEAGKMGFGDGRHRVKLTFSASVASYPEDNVGSTQELLGLVDQLLNKAKEFGGNRVYSSLDIKKIADTGISSAGGPNDIMAKMARLNRRMSLGLVEAMFAFARAASLKDNYSDELLEQLAYLAMKLAEKMGVPKSRQGFIKQAVFLRDLGKTGINEKVLSKTGKLSEKEKIMIKEHPVVSADIIRPIHVLHSVLPMVLYHHEHWDGTGYPLGLKGSEIPIEVQIVGLIDSFQALVSDRPYRNAYSREAALAVIRESSGKEFNPDLVKAFMEII